MNTKGFTLVELLAVIVILAIILAVAVPSVTGIIENAREKSFFNSAQMIVKAIEYKKLEDENFNPTIITKENMLSTIGVNGENYEQLNVTIVDGKLNINIVGAKRFSGFSVTKATKIVADSQNFQYDSIKGVNKPKLATGMTPIKWDGTTWTDTTANDTDWYNYTTTDKKWANARTADGSMWVWIPRYAYQITSAYHTNTAGIVNIKFLKENSNISSDNTSVDTNPTYSGSSQTNYVVNPAFTFGDTEVTGMWVAKYEASNDSHSTYNTNQNIINTFNYTNLVEGKEYFLGYSSYLSDWYLGTVEPLEEDYNCTFYANKKNTADFNRIYVQCDVPYKFVNYATTNYTGLGAVAGATGWYYWYKESIKPAGTISTIMSHTNTTMYFSTARFTSNVYWTVAGTTTPTTDLAATVNSTIYNNNHGNGNIKSVPNVSSWRGMVISNMYNKVKDMENDTIYGWNGNGQDIDTHLMKNSEWGAVSYLAQSTYGKNAEVWNNNSATYITGCSGDSATEASYTGCKNAYNTSNGQQASTTGNVYGIYDMAGGSYEYVMGTFNKTTLMSGFTDVSAITSKYINNYIEYNFSVNGDAIYETSSSPTGSTSWYGDYSNMMNETAPWLKRGGSYSTAANSGLFSYTSDNGAGVLSDYGFRPVILVENDV